MKASIVVTIWMWATIEVAQAYRPLMPYEKRWYTNTEVTSMPVVESTTQSMSIMSSSSNPITMTSQTTMTMSEDCDTSTAQYNNDGMRIKHVTFKLGSDKNYSNNNLYFHEFRSDKFYFMFYFIELGSDKLYFMFYFVKLDSDKLYFMFYFIKLDSDKIYFIKFDSNKFYFIKLGSDKFYFNEFYLDNFYFHRLDFNNVNSSTKILFRIMSTISHHYLLHTIHSHGLWRRDDIRKWETTTITSSVAGSIITTTKTEPGQTSTVTISPLSTAVSTVSVAGSISTTTTTDLGQTTTISSLSTTTVISTVYTGATATITSTVYTGATATVTTTFAGETATLTVNVITEFTSGIEYETAYATIYTMPTVACSALPITQPLNCNCKNDLDIVLIVLVIIFGLLSIILLLVLAWTWRRPYCSHCQSRHKPGFCPDRLLPKPYPPGPSAVPGPYVPGRDTGEPIQLSQN
ncbi:hypothetical protein V8E54_004295 [Elaphomyces granulatus]